MGDRRAAGDRGRAERPGTMLRAHRRWLRGARGGVRANQSGAPLAGADLHDADLRRADLTGENLRGANLRGARLSRARLGGADLSHANLTWANLSGAMLSGAVLTGARLAEANLSGANLSRAVLRSADLTGAHLAGAVLDGADLAQATLLGTTWGDGPRAPGAAGASEPARLAGASLRGAMLAGFDLSHADLTAADLEGADLRGADLRGACLFRARLAGALLEDADLEGADLEGADLSDTGFTGPETPPPPRSGAAERAVAWLTRDRPELRAPVAAALVALVAGMGVGAAVWLPGMVGGGGGRAPVAVAAGPAPAAAPGIVLRGRAPEGSWVEVRRGDGGGALLFVGTLAPGESRRWDEASRLWVRVGNTDGLRVAVAGRALPLRGGTGNFRIAADGVRRLPEA